MKILREILEELKEIKELLKSRNSLDLRIARSEPIIIPSAWQTPCEHEYPSPWLGVLPPTCKKCGNVSGPNPYQPQSITTTVGDISQTVIDFKCKSNKED